MADLTAFALSKMFTQLTGREVSFQNTSDLPGSISVTYGTYSTKPGDGVMVVKTDTAVVASLGAALLGLPKDSVVEQLKEKPGEGLRDAMHEIMNVASTTLSFHGRAVFSAMFSDPLYCGDDARRLLEKPLRIDRFKVEVEGYLSGLYAVYSDV